jgi:hypothetical protein
MDGGLYHEDFSFTSGCRIEEKYYAAYCFDATPTTPAPLVEEKYYTVYCIDRPLMHLFVLQNGKTMYDGL